MLRSPNEDISLLDKLLLLWTLCTIDWCRQNNERISNNNIARLFGTEMRDYFNCYREIAIDYGYLAPDSVTLTVKAMKVITDWRKIEEAILEC